MYQIRSGAFETNSSSSHALVIKNEGKILTPSEVSALSWITRGRLRIQDNGYCRSPFRVLTAPDDKLGYVLAAYHGTDQFESIQKRLLEYLPDVEKISFPESYEWVKDDESKLVTCYGYIDHESENVLPYAIQSENIDPLDIVLDTRYVIIVDGDEYDEFGKLRRAGLIDVSSVKKIYDPDTMYLERRSNE